MASVGRQFLLGRNARLVVDGVLLQSIQDAYVRVTADEIEAHHGGDYFASTIVVRRTVQVQFTLIDPRESRYLGEKMDTKDPVYPWRKIPNLVFATISRGHIIRSFYATLHDLDEDQSLRGVDAARFSLKQWGKLNFRDVPEDQQ